MAKDLPVAPRSATSNQQSAIPDAFSRRVVVERIEPEIDGGRFPIKRTAGETVDVSVTIFADGHDVVAAVLRDHASPRAQAPSPTAAQPPWRETAMSIVAPGTDRWTATFDVTENGWHEDQVVAWIDRFLTWRRDLKLKAGAGQDVSVELLEGSLLIRDAANRARERDGAWLLERSDALTESTPQADRVAAALGDELAAAMANYTDRSRATESPIRRVWVDRVRARFGAWYEMFPRSAGPDPTRSATFREACAQLPRIADMGFDVLYLPPIHPIGTSFRKGRNNALAAGPNDPGSPWAIGSPAGGHTAVDPGLGTLDDFEAFRCAAERLDLEIALDLAYQVSPDHPYVREHPEWFRQRPDGTIKYAENPPKKYQDIYPINFESSDWPALWQELKRVFEFWIAHRVRIFRVDNPHTKPFRFWHWVLGELHRDHPDTIFLSEAFTRPKVMRYLAKCGFSQSYSYFTWRNTAAELQEYFTELTQTDVREYMRPNLFANTPDILHEYLQHGGRPAFAVRLVLAATLGALYGIYSGFELFENVPVKEGSEEYLDSEKYQIRPRDFDRPDSLSALIRTINTVRRDHPALQHDHGLNFHPTDNPELLCYSKRSVDGTDLVLAVVNVDPFHMQHGYVRLPIADWGFTPKDTIEVEDLLSSERYYWS